MRLYNVLYFTDNETQYKSFLRVCSVALKTAYNKQNLVQILGSFKEREKRSSFDLSRWGIVRLIEKDQTGDDIQLQPLFRSSKDLMLFLEKFTDNLSDLIVLIDCNCDIVKNEIGFAKNFRSIMIEYPDVKFLFSSNPNWILFDKEDIGNELLLKYEDNPELCFSLCNSCLEELNCCSEKGEVKADFLKQLYSDDNGDCEDAEKWMMLKKLCRTKRTKYQKDKIREVRKRMSRMIALEKVNFDFITFSLANDSCLLDFVNKRDNLFDASNIRYAIKQWKYAELDVHSKNFDSVQKSRRDYLAVCVEEEKGQNRFNSYSLYTNGYRVLPITCAAELLELNLQELSLVPSVIIRDYDLQFYDSTLVKSSEYPNESDTIKAIRGFRDSLKEDTWSIHVFDSPCWSTFYKDYYTIGHPVKSFPKEYKHASQISISKRNTNPIPLYFISKGGWNVDVLSPKHFLGLTVENTEKKKVRCSHFINKKNKLCIPGLEKPLSGIHEPFQIIPEINERYRETRKFDSYYFNTSRENHAHGTSLDIYNIIKSLINRAKKYYTNGKFVHAAVLSNEAIEYLNGFHQSLMVEAYYINAISENALAMDAMVDEESLSRDTSFRVDKIRNDIERIYAQWGEKSKKRPIKMASNTLNQIYSDCRKVCREKEHFDSESIFIGAMARLNEGSFIFKYFNKR